MNDSSIGEPAAEILGIARAHGYSPTQVGRWRRAGLLPPATQRHLGRGRGTQTVYPPGTGERLRALCRIRSRERRIAYMAWYLWWAGYEVPMTHIRTVLQTSVANWERGLRELLDPATGQLSDAAWAYMDNAATVRLRHKALRQVRKQVGSTHMSTFVRIMLEVAAGTFDGYLDDDDPTILETGLGLARARKDRAGDADPWLSGDTGADLKSLSGFLSDHTFSRVLEVITDEDLTRASRDLSSIETALESFIPFLEGSLGRGAFGLHFLSTLFREMSILDRAILVLFWASVRAAGQGEQCDALVELAHVWLETGLKKAQAWTVLPIEVPAVSSVLAPQRIRAALRDQQAMARLIAAIGQVRQFNRADLDAFFQRHPELSTATDTLVPGLTTAPGT